MKIPRPSITRLARRAGVKSISDKCFNLISILINRELSRLVDVILLVNDEHQTKTIMTEDVYQALKLMDFNFTQSNDIGTSTRSK